MAYSGRKRRDSENTEEVGRKEFASVAPSIISNSEKQDASDLEKESDLDVNSNVNTHHLFPSSSDHGLSKGASLSNNWFP